MCAMYDFQLTSVLQHISITVTFILRLAVTSTVANCQSLIPILLEKPGAKGIAGFGMDLQEHIANYTDV